MIVCYGFQGRRKYMYFRKMVLESASAIKHFHVQSNPQCLLEVFLLALSSQLQWWQSNKELREKEFNFSSWFLIRCIFFNFQLQISEEKIPLFFKTDWSGMIILSFMLWLWVSYVLGPQVLHLQNEGSTTLSTDS